MAVTIDRWESACARGTYYFYWQYTGTDTAYTGQTLQGKACKAIADTWPGAPLVDAAWLSAANAWAEPIAQAWADRLDNPPDAEWDIEAEDGTYA